MVTGGERLVDRTEGENSSTGKTELQRKKRNSGKKPCKGGSSGVRSVAVGQGVQSRPPVAPGQEKSRELFLFGPQSTSGHQVQTAGCVWHQPSVLVVTVSYLL